MTTRERKTAASSDLGIVDGLVQLSFVIQGILGRIAARHELSLIQVRMLGVLRGREPETLELAAYLGLDKSSMSGLVSRAVRRGLVRRIATADDWRVVRVGLAARGRDVARQFAKEVAGELSALSKDLGDADRKHLSRLATALVNQAAQLPAAAPARSLVAAPARSPAAAPARSPVSASARPRRASD